MKIIQLHAENVKRLKAVEIAPDAGNEEVVRGQVEEAIAESLPCEPHRGPLSAAIMRGELGGNPSLADVMEHQSTR